MQNLPGFVGKPSFLVLDTQMTCLFRYIVAIEQKKNRIVSFLLFSCDSVAGGSINQVTFPEIRWLIAVSKSRDSETEIQLRCRIPVCYPKIIVCQKSWIQTLWQPTIETNCDVWNWSVLLLENESRKPVKCPITACIPYTSSFPMFYSINHNKRWTTRAL